MKDTYLAKDFRATAARRFPAQAAALNAAFDARLQALRADNAAAGKEKQFHLENQILPGIAAYETLQTVMPKEEALQTVHGYVEQRAWKLRKLFLALMHVPGLPRKTPGIFTKQTRRMFGEAAGAHDARFDAAATYLAMRVAQQRGQLPTGILPVQL